MMGICWKQRQRIYFSFSTFQVSIQHRASQKPLLRSEEWRICSECAQHIGNKESLLLLLSLVWLNIPPTHLPHKSQKALPPSQYFSPGKILGEPATPVSFPPPCQVEKEEEEGKGREGRRRILKFLALKSNSSRQESVKWLEVSLSVRNLRKKEEEKFCLPAACLVIEGVEKYLWKGEKNCFPKFLVATLACPWE